MQEFLAYYRAMSHSNQKQLHILIYITFFYDQNMQMIKAKQK